MTDRLFERRATTRALYRNAPLCLSLYDDCAGWATDSCADRPEDATAMRTLLDARADRFVDALHTAALEALISNAPVEETEATFAKALVKAYRMAQRRGERTETTLDDWYHVASQRLLVYLVELAQVEYLPAFARTALFYARCSRRGSVEHMLASGVDRLSPRDPCLGPPGPDGFRHVRQRCVDLAQPSFDFHGDADEPTHEDLIFDDRPGLGTGTTVEDFDFDLPAEPVPGLVVVPRVGGGSRGQAHKDAHEELKGVVGVSLPFYRFPADRREFVEAVAAEAPHARAVVQRIVELQGAGEQWDVPAFVLLGAPGGGKTAFLDALYKRAGVHCVRFACEASSDGAAAGTPRRWLTSDVCLPLRAVIDAGHANPAVVWDEISRVGGSRQGSGGTLRDALGGFLEPQNARRYRDPYVEAEVDLGRVMHAATANDLDGVAAQVRDRLVVLPFPLPTREHLPVLARRMALDAARRQGLPDDHAELDRTELQCLAENWPGGSLRVLRRLVEVAIQVRLQAPWATRH